MGREEWSTVPKSKDKQIQVAQDDDEGLDVYVFFPQASNQTLDDVQAIDEVRAVATLSGSFEAIAVATLSDIDALGPFLDRLRGGSVDPPSSVVLAQGPFARIQHSPVPAVQVFTQLWVQPGQAGAALKATPSLTGYLGASIVAGDYDILVELGGDTFDEVRNTLLTEIGGIPGLVRSASFFAFLRYLRE